jgi:hypothetical protein
MSCLGMGWVLATIPRTFAKGWLSSSSGLSVHRRYGGHFERLAKSVLETS